MVLKTRNDLIRVFGNFRRRLSRLGPEAIFVLKIRTNHLRLDKQERRMPNTLLE